MCDEVGLQPTVFYRWQKEFFENGAAAFEQKRTTNHSADQERIAYLQKKIQTKDEVLAELMAEHWGSAEAAGREVISGRRRGIYTLFMLGRQRAERWKLFLRVSACCYWRQCRFRLTPGR